MNLSSPRFFSQAGYLPWLALLVTLLAGAGPALSQAAAGALPPTGRRQADSARVAVLVTSAETIVRRNYSGLYLREQAQLQRAARGLQLWANTYLISARQQGVVALRYFKYLVMVGRYYAKAGDFRLALKAYQQAEAVIPARSPLRAKAGKYAQELLTYKRQVEALAATPPQGLYPASIRMSMAGSPPPRRAASEEEEADTKAVDTLDSWWSPSRKAPASALPPHSAPTPNLSAEEVADTTKDWNSAASSWAAESQEKKKMAVPASDGWGALASPAQRAANGQYRGQVRVRVAPSARSRKADKL